VRTVGIVVLFAALAVAVPRSDEQVGDFSGTWAWDPGRSDHHPAAETLIVTQSSTAIDIRGVMCCRQAGQQWTTTYHFNKWGSRNARPATSRTPVRSSPDTKQTQARWDGDTLLLHAGPDLDVRGGSLRLWRLAADGQELIEQLVNRGFGLQFDFKEASISRMYSRDKHVYIRKAPALF
jgi:hypothetical protein